MALGSASNSLRKDFWKEISCNSSSAVKVVHEKLHLCIPPYYLSDLGKSVASVIDCRLIRYEPDLGGILAGYGNLAIRESKAQTLFNLSDIHVDVVGNFYIFNPEVNQELVGIVNRISVDHIGCLVHGLFNISLPKPFNVASENWLGKPAKLLDKVKFSITKVDLYSIVPYIEGKIVELIPQAEPSTESRQRTSSDSGVEFASEESTNIALSPEESMEQKRSKLSLSQRKNEAKLSLTSKLNTVPTQNETCKILDEFNDQDKKRKRKISEDSVMKETPKKKKAKLFGGKGIESEIEDTAPVESLATNLFEKFSKKLEQSSTPFCPQKKVQISIHTETSIDAELVESNVVLGSEELADPIMKELQQTKSSLKKKTGKRILEGIEEQPKSPEKIKSQQKLEVEFEMKIDSDEETKISFKTPSSEKKSKSRLEKKNEGGSKLTEMKTPEKSVNQPASLKKSKDSKKVNGTATPSKSLKKKGIALEQEGEEEDNESIIQELLGLSLPITSPQSTPVLKKKQTPSAKSAKLAESAKKLKALEKKLDSMPKSVQVQGPETASPMKNLKESSLSKKSLKALASEIKQTPSVEKTESVSSPPRTPKANGSSKKLVKNASPEKISNASLSEKEVKFEQPKKRAKLRSNKEKSLKCDASSGDEFDQEEAILKILQSVQPKEKSDKTKTKRKSVNS
ncbi:hypothetical protein OUZ56_019086 [Daphnia magna]|uniref:DNA-directed RNA polymerase I subunit RPA43 n=1 Tax=Daphnia magna TaxID=35525 RepID=A0ABQ9ZAL8_9CRUS|nr:hypothetical protein OUZ56_019086 [Daphnia magna]